ncbi:ABC transporter permease [Cellulomonas chengniuliangii]|uniref:ABC transporter permease n=1 Tax=Cellulomonas chengniuliangii TaxID=2968084 RepID=A0ABY5KW83_9CELL|nr:ABC transporter permease [Cellulomonas chengniuliangii]MCC2309750.1 ABC transporter permease [Cellulomonas chengniuliangii]MCC2319046.1 ABC transporter permease [Cellulomonas chengniuliangii]UUI74704.1 ABC transporter permease [Cellulomonas chengniuliangii]
MTGFVSTLVEAWDELRVHRLRVLLALIGVAVAVTAITGITAAVQMMSQAFREQSERHNGRDVTLTADVYPAWSGEMGTTPPTPDPAQIDAAYTRITEQYAIEYWSRTSWTQAPFRFPTGAQMVEVRVVDPDYGVINRFQPTDGRWFFETDVDRLAPSVVVNEAFWKALGEPSLDTHPTVVLGGATPVRAEVIGVYPNSWREEPPAAYGLTSHMTRWATPTDTYGNAPSLRMWVPPEMSDELQPLITRDLSALMPGYEVSVYPNEFDNSLDSAATWIILGVGGFALLLGGLGLVNIALVTVRHRIREIGIRRSFGATSGRVFFGVLMESVVATFVAGLVGVVIAVAVVKNIPVERVFGGGIEDMPPFPLSAAAIGMACATGVGALAGLIPATVAVRVKVIDAIRY